jgi:xanthine permease XanP
MTNTSDLSYEEDVVEEVLPEMSTSLIYGLNDRPPLVESVLIASQHVLAIFVGIITPSIIIGNALELEPVDVSYLISMSLFVSGVATFIQARKIGPVGSGLLSIQGTSFAFVGPILGVGAGVLATGATGRDALALIFGLCFFGSFIEMFLSRFLHLAAKVITPIVTGTVVTIIGLSLIKVGVTSMGGGVPSKFSDPPTFGSLNNLIVSIITLLVIVILNATANRYLRMASIVIGLAVGYLLALSLGMVNLSSLSNLPPLTIPIPFKYGMKFDFGAFIPFMFLYLITTIESIGDLTATSAVSGEPIEGRTYMRRIKGGVLGDGVNSLIAAIFNTFPNTTFSQNNGVIQLTGVGSRYIGFYIAAVLVALGLVPIVGGVFQAMPQAVIGGATIIMFGSIAFAGIKILASVALDRRALTIVALSLALGLGVTFEPDLLANTPPLIKSIFSSGISTGGLCAILLNLLLPRNTD